MRTSLWCSHPRTVRPSCPAMPASVWVAVAEQHGQPREQQGYCAACCHRAFLGTQGLATALPSHLRVRPDAVSHVEKFSHINHIASLITHVRAGRPVNGVSGPPDTSSGDAPEMRHDDLLGEDVLQEEADNVRQVVMETARLLSREL